MTRYVSTRGPGAPLDFTDVLLAGMAPDGGLYVPDIWPTLDTGRLDHMEGLNYAAVAFGIVRPFIGGGIDDDTLRRLLSDTYERGAFSHEAVAPLTQIGSNAWLLELFHGPTLSFKDYALQFIGRLFDHVLAGRDERVTIVGATSGDTGSAAIEACRSSKNIDIFILHPEGRTSDIQRRQMTTVDAPNVFNIAIKGSFDDCQAIVKTLFADESLRRERNLSAVNSINWARIMAQTVYYVTAALALGAPERAVSFAVPTGNFGNVFAGWTARRMGLPIRDIIIGTNRNDILARFFESGTMRAETVVPSLSPSMDIQISSNFERYLFELSGRDHEELRRMMKVFAAEQSFSVAPDMLERAQHDFCAFRCTDEQTLETMRACHTKMGILIDPHTAVGLHAATQAMESDPATPMVIVSTAHPAKFPEAVRQATGHDPVLPPELAAVMTKAERYTSLPNDAGKVKDFIVRSLG